MHWGGGGPAFLSAFGSQNGAQNRVFLISFRGPILVMIFSSLRNDFMALGCLFGGSFLSFFCMYSHLIFCRKSYTESQFLLLITTLELALKRVPKKGVLDRAEAALELDLDPRIGARNT